jgi:MoaF-like
MTETVDYRVINLRPGLFVVAWQEPMGTVVQVEDFAESTDQGATLVAISGTIHEITA